MRMGRWARDVCVRTDGRPLCCSPIWLHVSRLLWWWRRHVWCRRARFGYRSAVAGGRARCLPASGQPAVEWALCEPNAVEEAGVVWISDTEFLIECLMYRIDCFNMWSLMMEVVAEVRPSAVCRGCCLHLSPAKATTALTFSRLKVATMTSNVQEIINAFIDHDHIKLV